MSHVSFYRKWRPQTFEDVLGQERVTRTLQHAIASGRVVHAYLFCGYRGTGKTTTARILAKALNCEHGPTPTPCNACAGCRAVADGTSLDVIEIDAASNRGIDEIRDLREKITRVPVAGRYSVYIIDEAHMLTTEAANALLKTLEEPPAHAVLVLVTTEPHRLPATITSRTQRFDFRRIPQPVIVEGLRKIAASEGFAVDEDALALIARGADGALRDAESLLDQVRAFAEGAVSAADVLAVLGAVEDEIVQELADAILAGDAARCLVGAGRAIDEGRDARQILRSLVDHFRDLLVVAVVREPQEIVETTETRLAALRTRAAHHAPGAIMQKIRLLAAAEAEARFATQPRIVLEMAMLRAARPEMDPSLDGLAQRVDAIERGLGRAPEERVAAASPPAPPPEAAPRASGAPAPAHGAGAAAPVRRQPSRAQPEGGTGGRNADTGRPGGSAPPDGSGPARPRAQAPPEDEGGAPVTFDLVRRNWARVMEEVKQRKRPVHAFLLESAPRELSGTELVLGVRHPFHMENLQDRKNRRIVEDALARVLGAPFRLRCILDAGPPPEDTEAPAPAGDALVLEAVRRFGNPVREIRRPD